MDNLLIVWGMGAVIAIGVFIYGHTKSGREWLKNNVLIVTGIGAAIALGVFIYGHMESGRKWLRNM